MAFFTPAWDTVFAQCADLDMPTTESDIPTEGDTVQLTVPEGAVGLTHADVDGTFTVVGSEVTPSGVRLHVVPTGADAPRYALMNEHVTTTD